VRSHDGSQRIRVSGRSLHVPSGTPGGACTRPYRALPLVTGGIQVKLASLLGSSPPLRKSKVKKKIQVPWRRLFNPNCTSHSNPLHSWAAAYPLARRRRPLGRWFLYVAITCIISSAPESSARIRSAVSVLRVCTTNIYMTSHMFLFFFIFFIIEHVF
jgi:hypothetical protein